tara:strand:+ start:515 stop:922 length:408 start_codon:yes stop_codon:yes gene_type:complete
MSSKWSKEDRAIWNNSEVMMELEKSFVDNVEFVKKFAGIKERIKSLTDHNEQLSEGVAAYKEVGQAADAAFSADDHEFGDDEDEANDGSLSDAKDSGVKDAVLKELRSMIKLATDKGNVQLAYRIERTIDEILGV